MRKLTQELSDHLSKYIEENKTIKIMGKNYKHSFLIADKLLSNFKFHQDGSFYGLYDSDEIVDTFNLINRNFRDLIKNIESLPNFIKYKSDTEIRDYMGEGFSNLDSPLEHIQSEVKHYGKSFALITNKLKRDIEEFQKNRRFNKTNIALIDACMNVWIKDLKKTSKPQKINQGNQSLFPYLQKIFEILKLNEVNVERAYNNWANIKGN